MKLPRGYYVLRTAPFLFPLFHSTLTTDQEHIFLYLVLSFEYTIYSSLIFFTASTAQDQKKPLSELCLPVRKNTGHKFWVMLEGKKYWKISINYSTLKNITTSQIHYTLFIQFLSLHRGKKTPLMNFLSRVSHEVLGSFNTLHRNSLVNDRKM